MKYPHTYRVGPLKADSTKLMKRGEWTSMTSICWRVVWQFLAPSSIKKDNDTYRDRAVAMSIQLTETWLLLISHFRFGTWASKTYKDNESSKNGKNNQMGLELTEQNRKTRSCVFCNEKGHDPTGCSTKKMERHWWFLICYILLHLNFY